MSERQSKFLNELGQTFVEYALIISLVVVTVIVALTFLQGKISSLFSFVGNHF
jgi:Flp pilus assembly pilin Flp